MAAEPENGSPQPKASEETATRGKGKMLGAILAAIMLIEGVGLYAAMKLLGAGPGSTAGGQGLVATTQQQNTEKPEVIIAKMKVPNRVTGKTYIYDVEVAATINVSGDKPTAEFKQEFEQKLQQHQNAISDRLSALIRAADPKYLDEPGLVTVRRQIKVELNKILKDEEVLDEILLPRWTPIRADM